MRIDRDYRAKHEPRAPVPRRIVEGRRVVRGQWLKRRTSELPPAPDARRIYINLQSGFRPRRMRGGEREDIWT